MHRRIAILATAALAVALGASPAGAAAPERYTDHFEHADTIVCSQFDASWNFNDNFLDIFDVRGQVWLDADGNPIRAIEHVHHVSNDVNSLTGFTLHEHNHLLVVYDFVHGTVSLSGAIGIMQRPGAGSVIRAAGHKILDLETGEPLTLRGPEIHSDEDFCRAVAP